MSDAENAGFGKFVPGFDFLQNLAKGASQAVPQMPSLSSWVAPSLNEEELDKRIAELKAVHFWLDQNSKALAATVQALEVQKMTLATLKGMNFNISDVANAFKLKATDTAAPGAQNVADKAEASAKTVADVADPAEEPAKKATKAAKPAASAATGMVDPMQLWSALTQQFQQIAAGAMKEASKATAMDPGQGVAGDKPGAVKNATGKKMAAKKAPAKAARKVAPKASARSR